MNGTDHQLPQPWLGRVVAEANAVQDDYRFVVTSLPEYLPSQPTAGLTTWAGELRSGARANVLMGVASNRVDVHRACAAAERALERRAEPLSALLRPAEDYPTGLLEVAWRQVVLNSAHDSSCACSHDEVVDAVRVRYQEARQIGDTLTRAALHAHASRVAAPAGATLVVNPTRADRGGLVEGVVPGAGPVHLVADDGTPCPTQVTWERGTAGFAAVVTGQKVRWVLELIRGPEFAAARIAEVTRRAVGDDDWEYTFRAAGPGEDADRPRGDPRGAPGARRGRRHDPLQAGAGPGPGDRVRRGGGARVRVAHLPRGRRCGARHRGAGRGRVARERAPARARRRR